MLKKLHKSVFAFAASIATIGLLSTAPGPAMAQQYPNRPIKFVVPYTVGGVTTLIARLLSDKLTEAWGQRVIIENMPGGNAAIGTYYTAKAAPDGYTILLIAAAHVVVPILQKTQYDPIKDFTPITTIDASDQLLVVSPTLPVKNLQELIALAKSKPQGLTYGSAGVGSSNHLASELLNLTAGIQVRHVPYKGQSEAVTDVMGSYVDMTINNPASVLPQIQGGNLKAIAMSGGKRVPGLPDVPTFAEQGYPGFEAKNWHAILAPAGVPKDIAAKLSTELARIINDPEITKVLTAQGVEPFVLGPEKFTALLESDSVKWAKVIKEANIKLVE